MKGSEVTGRLKGKVCVVTGTGGSMERATADIDVVVDGGMKVW